MQTNDGILEPLWSSSPVLPSSLVDLLEKCDSDEEMEDEDDELDYDSFTDSDNE